jgi:hypothetical protein
MSTMEPVKIYPATNLYEEMPDKVEDFFAWMRSNGVDPDGVPMDKEVIIGRGMIDFYWWTGPKTPEPQDAHALQRWFESDQKPLSHLQLPLKHPLPDDLASALRKLNEHWDDLKRQIYGLNVPCPNCGHQRD